ncbi:Ebp2-domain-containing protein, partial [Lepidopterella palustris CBS 459.81]
EEEEEEEEEEEKEEKDKEDGGVQLNGDKNKKLNGTAGKKAGNRNGVKKVVEEEAQWETDDDEDDMPERAAVGTYLSSIDTSRIDDTSDSGEAEDKEEADDMSEDNDEEEDIALSDIESLDSEDRGDVIPHQRLTINNTTALLAALHRIQLPTSTMPFSEYQSLTTDVPVSIADVEDDLTRELAFYSQSLSAVKEARTLLKKEGVQFSRPTDYFAEMVKSDEHMGKIKQKLVDAAASKKAAADARRQRDLKKFGKQVQVAKLQERAKAKTQTLEKINVMKRKRQGAELTTTNEEDLFDVALDDAAKSSKTGRRDSRPNKRQKKDEKFGFGGKKRFAKSNDAKSNADMSGYSTKRMKEGKAFGKAKGTGGASKRLGKSRRTKRT